MTSVILIIISQTSVLTSQYRCENYKNKVDYIKYIKFLEPPTQVYTSLFREIQLTLPLAGLKVSLPHSTKQHFFSMY